MKKSRQGRQTVAHHGSDGTAGPWRRKPRRGGTRFSITSPNRGWIDVRGCEWSRV